MAFVTPGILGVLGVVEEDLLAQGGEEGTLGNPLDVEAIETSLRRAFGV